MNDFAVIIITHKRPDCDTYSVLRKSGYTGKIFLVVDDGDPTVPEYKEKYGDEVKVFHKKVDFDIGDNFDGPNSIATFARNHCWKVAVEEKLKTFLMLDDDLEQLTYRYAKDGKLKGKKVTNADWLFDRVSEWLLSSNMGCVSFGIAMDYIGGIKRLSKSKRTAMNSFFLRTDRRFEFLGRYSEDQISPVLQNKIGNAVVGFTGVQAQFDVWTHGKPKANGGCQSAYRDVGSFSLRFYEVMWHPDCIHLRQNENEFMDSLLSKYAFPMILSGRYRK